VPTVGGEPVTRSDRAAASSARPFTATIDNTHGCGVVGGESAGEEPVDAPAGRPESDGQNRTAADRGVLARQGRLLRPPRGCRHFAAT
jgi:hypothetical protein